MNSWDGLSNIVERFDAAQCGHYAYVLMARCQKATCIVHSEVAILCCDDKGSVNRETTSTVTCAAPAAVFSLCSERD